MALRLVLLLAMACLCAAQTTDTTTPMATTPEATTPEATTPEATTPEATTQEATTQEATTQEATTPEATTPEIATEGPTAMIIDPPGNIQDQVNAEFPLGERYQFRQAVDFRRVDHFFCPGQGEPFLVDGETEGNNAPIIYNWSIFLQYPILAYLDTMKKTALVNQIIAIIEAGGFNGVNTNNLCIGAVEHFDVSLYTESVLINFYLIDATLGETDFRVSQIDDAFREGLMTQMNNETLLQDFLGQQAIVINNSTYGEIDSNVHPGAFDVNGMRFAQSDDPTLRAVILGYWPRQYRLADFVTDRDLNASITARFAINPNPVFYGLTGGDYVFIVIATLLCVLLSFLMVFGFCIQPFFM